MLGPTRPGLSRCKNFGKICGRSLFVGQFSSIEQGSMQIKNDGRAQSWTRLFPCTPVSTEQSRWLAPCTFGFVAACTEWALFWSQWLRGRSASRDVTSGVVPQLSGARL